MPSLIYLLFLLLLDVLLGEKLERHKRFLYYPHGGGFKLVLGFAIPVELGLKQSMGWGWNIQFQYAVPLTTNDTSVYPPIISRARVKRDLFAMDRIMAYKGLEMILDRHGFNGRMCLLRAVCESALDPLHHPANGLYGQLLHIFLTPDYSGSDLDLSVYLEAAAAGRFGVECSSLYPDCEDGLLDLISVLGKIN